MEELYKYFGIYFKPEKVSKQNMINYLRETIKEYNKMKSNEYQQRKSSEMLENYPLMDEMNNATNEKIFDFLLYFKSEIKCLQEPEKRYEIKELYKKINNEEKRKNYKSNINSSEEQKEEKMEKNDLEQKDDENEIEGKTNWSFIVNNGPQILINKSNPKCEKVVVSNLGRLYYSKDMSNPREDTGIYVIGLSKIIDSKERNEIIFCELRKATEEKKERIMEKVLEDDQKINYIMNKEEGFLGVGVMDVFGGAPMKQVKDKVIRDRKIAEFLGAAKKNKCKVFGKADDKGVVVEFSKLIESLKTCIKLKEDEKGENECQK